MGYWTCMTLDSGYSQERFQQLKNALSKVRTLKGLIPICACCKKIRDDNGYWNQLEAYFREHSEARFSHGICPECSNRIYPDLRKIHEDV